MLRHVLATTLVAALAASLVGCSSGRRSSGAAATAAPLSSQSASPTSSGGGPASITSGSTSGGSTSGGSTAGGSTAGGSTAGGSTAGGSTAGSGGSGAAPGAPPGTGGAPIGGSGGRDTAAPAIALSSPARGLFTTQAAVRVQGTILDASGVAFFLLGGNPVTIGAGGAFDEAVALQPGLNVIELHAADPVGNQVRVALPVVSGQYLPEASVVPEAVAVRLNRPAFDAIERLAARQLAGTNLGQMIMAQNPLYTGSYGLATLDVAATGASFGPATLDLDPRAGGLQTRVVIPSIAVDTEASGRVVGVPYRLRVRVTADRATVDSLAVVSVAPGGVVTTQLQGVQVALDNFRFDVAGIPTFLENLARTAVRRLVEDQVRRQVEQVVPQEVNRAIAGANGPITRTVLGRQVTVHLIPRAVVFDAQGCSVLTDGDMRLPAPAGLSLPTTPGSLVTAGAAPVHPATQAFHVAANDDLLNRMGHAAWRGGLMSLKVDQAFVSRYQLPSWFQLDAFWLTVFFPSLAARVNPADPIELEVTSATPALFRTLPGPDTLEAAIGDLTLSVWVAPAGQPRVLVLRTGVQVQVGLTPTLTTQSTLRVAVNGRPRVRTDVFETPLVPIDTVAVENFIDFVVPPVIQVLARVWSGMPLPVYPGLQPTNVQVERAGPAGDFVTVRGDL